MSSLGRIASIASEGEKYPLTVFRFILQSTARELLPHERVADCLRKRIPTKLKVEVRKRTTTKRAFYANLQVCGSVWHCPICAARISEKRRQELSYALKNWTGGVCMVTYTFSHQKSDALSVTLKGLKEAFRWMKSGRLWQEIKDEWGWIGSVRGLEVTYTDAHGWHSHIHELVFFTNDIDGKRCASLENNLSHRWRRALSEQGMSASAERGLKVSAETDFAKEYIAKFGSELVPDRDAVKSEWTFSHEITKQPVKRSRKNGRTPSQLLADASEYDAEARFLWKEYAMTFKGSHQLEWSKGLRKMLGMLNEKPDDELAVEPTEDSVLLASLTESEWRTIQERIGRGELLYRAETMDEIEFAQMIAFTLNRYM